MKNIEHFLLTENTNSLYKKEAISSIGLTRDIADKINELVDAYNQLAEIDLEWKQTQEGIIRKGVLFMKDNLVNSLNDLLDLLLRNGYVDEKIAIKMGGFISEIGSLSSRLDNLFANIKEGSTTLDNEIIDARVDAKGFKYKTLADAVHLPITQIMEELKSLYVESENLINKRRVSVGMLNETTGNVITDESAGTVNTYNIFETTDFMKVERNKTYILQLPVVNAYHRYMMFDGGCTPVDNAVTVNALETEIIIPSNVMYIRVTYLKGYSGMSFHKKGSLDLTMGGFINGEEIAPNTINNKHIADNSLNPVKIKGYVTTSNNLFDKHKITHGFLKGDGKILLGDVFEDYFHTDFIPVESETLYSLSHTYHVVFYDEKYSIIGSTEDVNNLFTITTPVNCAFIRNTTRYVFLNTLMINKGSEILPFEPYSATFDFITTNSRPRKYTLSQAVNNWLSGYKFPIGFLGDSTTDGMGTTAGGTHQAQDETAGGYGKVDYINTYAYPYKLEKMLQKATNNDALRVYNMGYSGTSFNSIMQHYDAIFSGVYSDVKMVGIVYGINDRLQSGEATYYSTFRNNLVETINYLYDKDIQPFMVTTQATLETACADNLEGVNKLRTAEAINSIANRIKKEVADEYGLEIIDMNAYGEFMLEYSSIPITDICVDGLHFKDVGHTFEAEFLFAEICGRCVDVIKDTIITLVNQHIKSECPSNYLKRYATTTNGFKVYIEYVKNNTSDILIQDVVFNVKHIPVSLVTYCEIPNTQYIEIDGEVFNITEKEQTIKTLDVGVHWVRVMSGSSTSVNWTGLKLKGV